MAGSLPLSLFLAIIAMSGYGVVDVLAFLLSRQADHTVVPLWTTSLSVVFLSLGIFFFGPLNITPAEILLLVIAGIIGAGALISFYRGLNVGKIAVVVPIANTWPIISVLIGLLLLKESLLPVQILGMALAIAGTVLVSFKFKDVVGLKFSKVASGAEYAVITMLGWGAFYTLVGYVSAKIGGYWPALIAQMLVAAGMLVYLVYSKKKIIFPVKVKWKLVAFGALISISFLAYALSSGLGYVSVSATITGSSPVVTVILGVLLLKERIEPGQILAIALIVAGIALISLA